jgi:hypothetical protein
MGKIISFHDNPVVELKKELKEKDVELDRIRHELSFFKTLYSTTNSIGDLLKLQLADMTSNVMLLQGHLNLVQENLMSVRGKIENLDGMKNKIKIIE